MGSWKLLVEVCNAKNLMPKDGEGSSSPYVEVEFHGQKHRTTAKTKDLNPVWGVTMEFHLTDPAELAKEMVEVTVYNLKKNERRSSFLGRVCICGANIVQKGQEAFISYPLQKRSLFSHIKGELGLKVYYLQEELPAPNPGDSSTAEQNPPPDTANPNPPNPPLEQPQPQQEAGAEAAAPTATASTDAAAPAPPAAAAAPTTSTLETQQVVETGGSLEVLPANSSTVHATGSYIYSPTPSIHYSTYRGTAMDHLLRETSPLLAATATNNCEKVCSYDLVEKMQYLYVRVVKARGLSCNTLYVRVAVGSHSGHTPSVKGIPSSPDHHDYHWNQVFAFDKLTLHGSTVETMVLEEGDANGLLGVVTFDLQEIPTRVPPDSPLAPQWYRLDDRGDDRLLMLAVWMGTQADEAFTEAWQPNVDTGGNYSLTSRSKVYMSPKLWYLRVNVIEAQDLPIKLARFSEVYVTAKLGFQCTRSRVARDGSSSPFWNQDLSLVAAEPFEEHLILTVEDHVAMNKDEILGQVRIGLNAIERRVDGRPISSRWFNLDKPEASNGQEKENENETKSDGSGRSFRGRIHLRICFDGGYHVIDEGAHLSSDYRPTAKQLWKPPLGLVELGILGCQGLLPTKTKDGHGATDAYCVAKYGPKWVRTRTIMDSFSPRWNEQYTWDVFDPCTVLTVGVFDNHHHDKGTKDASIGKVRIRLSTLESQRVYTNSYPLLKLHPSGTKKMGELELVIRFSIFSLFNVMQVYSQPMLPPMHYRRPLGIGQQDSLRHSAMTIVALRMARSEPPLHYEVVQYMLDTHSNLWSMRRSKTNWFRIMSVLSGPIAIVRWVDDICKWRNTMTTLLIHILFLILAFFPELILPTMFLYMFLIGAWNYHFRPRAPPHMDPRISHAYAINLDEIEEEFDNIPTSKPYEVLARRYDQLRGLASRIQTVLGDIASQGERVQALLNWRDPRATSIFILFCLTMALLLYTIPFQVLIVLSGLYFLRHPRFRESNPPIPLNFFRRLPALSDRIL